MPDPGYHRSLDIEAGTDPSLLEPKRKLRAGLIGLCLAAGVSGLFAVPLFSNPRPQQGERAASDEAFMPSRSSQLNLTPPPERKETPLPLQAAAIEARTVNTDDSESRRRSAEEDARRRAEAEEAAYYAKQQDRYRSRSCCFA